MAYSEAVLHRAKAILQQERQEYDRETYERTEAVFRRVPRLREIEAELRSTGVKIMRTCLGPGADPSQAMEQLRQENLALQQERDWLLESNDIDPSELDRSPICRRCGGTGYVGAVMCECLQELCRQEQKKELTVLFGSGHESFERFRLDYYPQTAQPGQNVSPRQVMTYIFNHAQHYAKTFTEHSGSLLFVGATGLGKTFLSACIARTVAEKGYSVCYVSAEAMFSDFETDKFHPHPDGSLSRKYLSCDLLILDDLGTEMTTQFTVSALYQVVNTRLMEGRPTLISTNLPLAELEGRYSAQIASRILGSYETFKFIGNDIRLLKKTKG